VHLAPFGVTRAVSRAMHVMAAICIGVGVLFTIGAQIFRPEDVAWPAALAMLIFGAALWVLDRHTTVLTTIAYLVIGATCIYWYVLVGTSQYGAGSHTDVIQISVVKVALILVGGAGIGALPTIGWAIAGWALAELATILAVMQTGSEVVFDGTPAITLALVIVVLSAIGVNRYRVRLAKPSLHRAARDEYNAAVRHRMEVKAAAMLHDTVLNHLAALGASPDGPLKSELRHQISRDLEVLVGQEWLVDDANDVDPGLAEWHSSRLARSIDEATQLGLFVEVSGDRTALGRVGNDRAVALALAVKQCLVNVAKHAGVDRAEVVIYGAPQEVSVMVIDAGAGFDVEATGSDRLGLRNSVHSRIESIGGSVQIWSSIGGGTSVLMRVPTDEPRATDATDDAATSASIS
jgi:signal transduction histidine kinase